MSFSSSLITDFIKQVEMSSLCTAIGNFKAGTGVLIQEFLENALKMYLMTTFSKVSVGKNVYLSVNSYWYQKVSCKVLKYVVEVNRSRNKIVS